MPEEEVLTIEERYKYLRGQQRRYKRADRGGKGRLLDEMEAVTGLSRKALVRLMAGECRRGKRQQQRGVKYGQETRQAVVVVGEALDWICAERLTPALEWTARQLMAHGELPSSEVVLEQLGHISTSTVRRIMGSQAKEQWRLPQRRPAPNPIAKQVQVERIPWDIREAGHVEMDLVHHGGSSSAGEYLHTLQVVDVASGWSERAVVVGRSYLAMRVALEQVMEQLPFPLLEVHCDNGPEFLNYHLLRFWQEQASPPALSRSRPYHKNDNRYAEQRNSSLVRAYVGYQRLDSPLQAQILCQIYDLMHYYHNLFQPVMHLVGKSYLHDAAGHSHVKRYHDRAATPFDRLVALGALGEGSLEEGQRLRRTLNPRQMRLRLYELLAHLRATSPTGHLGDVRRIIAAMHSQGLITIPTPKEAALAR